MYRPSRGSEPQSWTDVWISLIFLFLIFGLFTMGLFQDYRPAKLAPVFVFLFWFVLLVTHEAGHALAAALLGWRLGRMVLGMGKKLGSFRIGPMPVEVRLVPIEGFVECVPTNLRLPRIKSALIYFAGPGMDLLLGSAALFWGGPDRFMVQSQDYGHILWQSFIVAAFAQGILNLIPHGIQTAHGIMANDGLGIIRSFTVPIDHYARMVGYRFDPEKE